jgi:dephospho-CoA kinase
MLKVGLTGGIASGKSLAAEVFRSCGAGVIDADRIARQVVVPDQPGWHRIVEHFGTEVLNADRTLDRERMAAIVFGDVHKRELLNSLVHPLIVESLALRIRELSATGSPGGVIIADVPLLFECGCQGLFDRILLIWTERRLQKQRLMQRDGITANEAEQRLAAQMPLDEKISLADYVVKNTKAVGDCTRAVRELYGRLVQEGER